jgi:hypothetical protein
MSYMHRFWVWIEREPVGTRALFMCTMGFYTAAMIYVGIVTWVVSFFSSPDTFDVPATGTEVNMERLTVVECLILLPVYFSIQVPWVIAEEVIFRTLPLAVAMGRKFSKKWILVTILVANLAFAATHFMYRYPFLMQGVLGVMLSVAYMKLGGLQQRATQATFLAVVVHGLYNATWMLYNDPAW